MENYTICGKSQILNSKDGIDFAMLLPFGKSGGLQILRSQGFEVKDYDFTLDVWTLKPSIFCNIGVTVD